MTGPIARRDRTIARLKRALIRVCEERDLLEGACILNIADRDRMRPVVDAAVALAPRFELVDKEDRWPDVSALVDAIRAYQSAPAAELPAEVEPEPAKRRLMMACDAAVKRAEKAEAELVSVKRVKAQWHAEALGLRTETEALLGEGEDAVKRAESAEADRDAAIAQCSVHEQAYEDEHKRATRLQERVTHLETERDGKWRDRYGECARAAIAEKRELKQRISELESLAHDDHTIITERGRIIVSLEAEVRRLRAIVLEIWREECGEPEAGGAPECVEKMRGWPIGNTRYVQTVLHAHGSENCDIAAECLEYLATAHQAAVLAEGGDVEALRAMQIARRQYDAKSDAEHMLAPEIPWSVIRAASEALDCATILPRYDVMALVQCIERMAHSGKTGPAEQWCFGTWEAMSDGLKALANPALRELTGDDDG